MRYGNLLRFLILAFAAGSLLGLGAGLVSGDSTVPSPSSEKEETNENDSGISAGRLTAEDAELAGSNELGRIMVLEYHQIGETEEEWTRTPEGLRKDIALLKQAGYSPVNVRDLVSGSLDVPAGKTPVVFTFDDSSPGQYRVLDDGSTDPESAVGILQEASKGQDWDSRGSFYCLLDVQPDDNVLFGQPDRQRMKLANLADWGYEVGSHTVTHLNLAEASAEESRKQLAQSKSTLEALADQDYVVNTISVPFGEYPEDISILESGTWEDESYAYRGALMVAGGPAPSPFSTSFEPLRIPRIQVREGVVEEWINYFKDNPELRYISDGDLLTVSVPTDASAGLGNLTPGLARPVLRY